MFRKPYHNKLHPPPTSIGGGVLASAAIKKGAVKKRAIKKDCNHP